MTTDPDSQSSEGDSSPGSDDLETKTLPHEPDGDREQSSEVGEHTRRKIGDRVRGRLFGAPPVATDFGRFKVLEPIGRGGMGMVYAAYDEQLDRKVAIKVLHDQQWSSPDARLRFQREAQAMARLSHPNVATVHEVGESNGAVFLAMEFIRGDSVATWIRTEPDWREVIDVFIQAGRGLCAAHEAGLVHRDLKPHNIMRSDDGVVKVLDFGLARAASDELGETQAESQASPSASSSVLAASFTQTGSILGTPAYMSPEQFRGESDARSDQFSFCVALYEALYGRRPFDARSVRDHQEPGARPLVPPVPTDGKVPASIYKAIARGLKTDPEERWPSMEALLEPLQASVVPRRRRLVAPAVAVIGLLGVGAGLVANRWTSRCSGAQDQLEGVWDDDRRQQVRTAILGSGRTFAASTWSRVEPRLDEYAQAWVHDHTEACEATAVRHEQSEEHLGLRMSCLRRRQQHLRATVDELAAAKPAAVERAVQAVTSLPPLSRCADIEALAAEVPPPEDSAVAQRVAELDAQLVDAAAKHEAGEYDHALAVARAVVTEAEALGYEPLIARGRLRQGRLEYRVADYEGAVESFESAYEVALTHRMIDEASDAATRLVRVLGAPLSRHEQARRWTAHAEPLSHAAGTDAARALYLDSLGYLAHHEGQYDEARDSFERALAIQQRSLGPDHPKVATVLKGLGLVAKDQGELLEAYDYQSRALSIIEQSLGPDHPEVGGCLQALGTFKYAQGEIEQAGELFEQGLAIYEQAYGPDHPQVSGMLSNLGLVAQSNYQLQEARRYFERGLAIETRTLGLDSVQRGYSMSNLGMLAYQQHDLGAAREFFEGALTIFEDQLGPNHPHLARPLAGLGNVARVQGGLQEAVELQSRSAAIVEQALGPDHPDLAHPLTNLGGLLLTLDKPQDALEMLERALELRTSHGIDPNLTAETRLYLARALWDVQPIHGQDRPRAYRLVVEARDVWGGKDGGPGPLLDQAETWLAEHAEPTGTPAKP
ncbi:MAG: tetratricopeptide repeat protein [Nannocystaceae bacterium]